MFEKQRASDGWSSTGEGIGGGRIEVARVGDVLAMMMVADQGQTRELSFRRERYRLQAF